MTLNVSPRHLVLAAFCATSLAGTAVAGTQTSSGFSHIGPSPAGLPSCNSTEIFDACRLPVKQGMFDSLQGWTANGMVSQGSDASGNGYAAIRPGSSVRQAVYASFGTPNEDASYVLRFRLLSESHDAPVRATLSMSNAAGTDVAKLGATTTMARHHEWTEVELVVDGKAFRQPAHVMIEIGNEDSAATVQVDDVFLVQSADAEVGP
ncbi:hypothetical protein SAMN02800692_2559 [Luteibacter sp. UNC138MFCol5.1]|uniref:hypothetical protein n=1 Tax=Luteibacter sp. UNC138MFCol5.1 TaxID=1502774 RepID=UPI0008AEC570|nr:hypothetical protein [Luteibacter sp. UNC138MFCol5.1]SEO85665.1 hypothetical protein SAMN02800692_2559 [Luteibacter sp. UNC138MFCol5.1]